MTVELGGAGQKENGPNQIRAKVQWRFNDRFYRIVVFRACFVALDAFEMLEEKREV
jgi:hypothetical protein